MAIAAAVAGAVKGRDGVAWFFYGLLIWPVALVHALALPPKGSLAKGSLAKQAPPPQARPANSATATRPCPWCAEPIQPAARVCRFCGRDVERLEPTLGPAPAAASPAAAPPAAPGPRQRGFADVLGLTLLVILAVVIAVAIAIGASR